MSAPTLQSPTPTAGDIRRPRVTVVIPTLNEEGGIGPTLDAIPRKSLAEAGYDLEILVVDGESTDRTREVAERLGARVLVEKRKGYGRAYKTGFAAATGDVIVTADADTTYPLEAMHELVAMLDERNVDFITGNRFGKMRDGAMSPMHKVGNFILSTTGKLLFFVNVRDSQSGMWVFRRSILQHIKLTSDGMPLSEEIKIEAFRSPQIRAIEVPIEYRIRVGEVKLASWRDGYRNMAFLWKKRLGLH